MNRSLFIWAPFAACVTLVLAAMAWVTSVALRLDDEQAAARRQAVLEENTRLALWRMDYAVGPLISEIAGQPYFAFASFYPLSRAYANMFNDASRGEVMLPSPLLTPSTRFVQLFFQVDERGAVTSPQAPRPPLTTLAVPTFIDDATLAATNSRLEELSAALAAGTLAAGLPELPDAPMQTVTMCSTNGVAAQPLPNAAPAVQPPPNPAQTGRNVARGQAPQPQTAYAQQQESNTNDWNVQQKRSIDEAQARERSYQTLTDNSNLGNRNFVSGFDVGEARQSVVEGPMSPVWLGSRLIVARRVRVGESTYMQGAWLDWPALRESLTGGVADLLPQAQLEALDGEPVSDRERRLAALPVRLLPGEFQAQNGAIWSPIRVALPMAWVCVCLASGAIGVLLFGADSLGRRRAAFASAVTHELRTPLTTFRLYSEMLARGAVTDPQKRREYFQTLQTESERLGHLVENVLAYSRLERGRGVGPVEAVRLGELIERVRERLGERAAQSGLRFAADVEPYAANALVHTNTSAVEQILFNLVDNACKYAGGGGDRSADAGSLGSAPRDADLGGATRRDSAPAHDANITLSACIAAGGAPGQTAMIRVRDYGPGIARTSVRRIFRVFHKSAHDAAASAPGVGLGLALSRKLARGLGGELRLERGVAPGACFALELPLAPRE